MELTLAGSAAVEGRTTSVDSRSDACPNDSAAGGLAAVSPAVYKTEFSVPASAIGRKTIVEQISGPLAKNRVYVRQYCGEPKCTFNLVWHGQVRFTRTRVMKTVIP